MIEASFASLISRSPFEIAARKFSCPGKLDQGTVVGDNIKIMKTTFEFNFDFYQALNSKDTQKYGNEEKLLI